MKRLGTKAGKLLRTEYLLSRYILVEAEKRKAPLNWRHARLGEISSFLNQRFKKGGLNLPSNSSDCERQLPFVN